MSTTTTQSTRSHGAPRIRALSGSGGQTDPTDRSLRGEKRARQILLWGGAAAVALTFGLLGNKVAHSAPSANVSLAPKGADPAPPNYTEAQLKAMRHKVTATIPNGGGAEDAVAQADPNPAGYSPATHGALIAMAEEQMPGGTANPIPQPGEKVTITVVPGEKPQVRQGR
jgi:hypothetical protein